MTMLHEIPEGGSLLFMLVLYEDQAERLDQGWRLSCALPMPHGYYSVLMERVSDAEGRA